MADITGVEHTVDCSQKARGLRYILWRYIAIAGFSAPIFVALSVSLLGLSFSLPPCLFQATFEFPSPSCGLTRSFLALVRGDWQTALSFHLFGPFLAVVFTAIAGVACVELVTRQSHLEFYKRVFCSRNLLTFIGLFLAYYGIRLWARYTLPELPWDLEQTQLWQLFLEGALAL